MRDVHFDGDELPIAAVNCECETCRREKLHRVHAELELSYQRPDAHFDGSLFGLITFLGRLIPPESTLHRALREAIPR